MRDGRDGLEKSWRKMNSGRTGGRLSNWQTSESVLDIGNRLIWNDRLRKLAIRALDYGIIDRFLPEGRGAEPARMRREKELLTGSIAHTVDRLISRRAISPGQGC